MFGSVHFDISEKIEQEATNKVYIYEVENSIYDEDYNNGIMRNPMTGETSFK